ncbi:unnamed protein product [Paramecium pentaurelia]|uniref:Transmembrane protein n=1 Tax=Paramecium pentaurelia TaxID=43138 RepID=A0A8S1WH64_9CILI|nr:unnamed protein product [Paramecium pentaurelia]
MQFQIIMTLHFSKIKQNKQIQIIISVLCLIHHLYIQFDQFLIQVNTFLMKIITYSKLVFINALHIQLKQLLKASLL